MSKTVALALILVFLTASTIITFLPVKAENKTIVVPDDYPTMSDAIRNANQGDTIFVKTGTYNEQVLSIDKPLQIIGENANNTKIILHPSLIFGGYHSVIPYYYYHQSITVSANNVELSNFTISYQETNEPPPDLPQHILGPTSPIYLVGGGGALVISGNNTNVSGNIFSNTPVTIEGANSQISANSFKMSVECRGSNNQIFHNNFMNQFFKGINDVPQAYDVSNAVNFWDDCYPSGGNYWVDYQTRYPYSKMIDASGIGNTPYSIGSNNDDRYPLMSPFNYTSYLTRITPPKISVISPINLRYFESNISLDFNVDKPINWISYSLDGGLNQTTVGNSTLLELSTGLHNVTIYANDTFGNIGSSQSISFNVAKPESESFPVVPVIAVSVAVVALVVAGLLVYHKRMRGLVKKI
jgi:hypothetical protein